MKITDIELINFKGVAVAMQLTYFHISFADIKEAFIQINAPNGCGKSVLLSQLHPFSSLNLNGDDRSDLGLIIPGETGIKRITYDDNGKIYCITHTYKPNSKSHTVYSSITEDGVELNSNGGVKTFNSIIEKIFGINQYIFSFIINGSQLTSFAKLSDQQRKVKMNKAMGIDIYGKIHKLSTDDYRYTNKLISSLNSTKEFLISSYGTYENLVTILDASNREYQSLDEQCKFINGRMNQLSGKINQIRNQNVQHELYTITNQIESYNNVINSVGNFNQSDYDSLIDRQISTNSEMSELKSRKMILLNNVDTLYDKRNTTQNQISNHNRAVEDYNNMEKLIRDLTDKINEIEITTPTSVSSEKYKSLYSLAQTINTTCKEIVTCLNKNHLDLFVKLIDKHVNISAFLLKEGAALLDTEKEKNVVSRIRCMVNNVNGEYIDCPHKECIYKQTHEMLESYFMSYQSSTSDKMTQYDIDQMDHAYKNVQVITRLISIEIPDELTDTFKLETIMYNIQHNQLGIDVDIIKNFIEGATNAELRNMYIQQLSESKKTLESMTNMINSEAITGSVEDIDELIKNINQQISDIDSHIKDAQMQLTTIDDTRLKLSSIQHIDIKDLMKQQSKLMKLNDELRQAEEEFDQLSNKYNMLNSRMMIVSKELEKLNNDNKTFITNEAEIIQQLEANNKYKIISEATSSSKGKPVEAIRSKVNSALALTNRLLDVLYEGDVQMMEPIIDEFEFTLPFRVGTIVREDIRYGSQSEESLISMALSLSLASSLTPYNVPLLDEMDAYMDITAASSFVSMLSQIMIILNMEQLFIISHKIINTTYGSENTYVINLYDEILKLRKEQNHECRII